jgi:transposase
VPLGLVGIGVIQLTAQMRILVAVASIDVRAGIDGLARICQAQLAVDPFCGWLCVFCNRRRTAVKILTYDGQGFWLATKRLSQGKFPYWPTDGPIQELQAHPQYESNTPRRRLARRSSSKNVENSVLPDIFCCGAPHRSATGLVRRDSAARSRPAAWNRSVADRK